MDEMMVEWMDELVDGWMDGRFHITVCTLSTPTPGYMSGDWTCTCPAHFTFRSLLVPAGALREDKILAAANS